MDSDTRELLATRAGKYGETWKLAGLVLAVVKEPYMNLIEQKPEVSQSWVLMLTKLIRILYSPNHLDNYKDLIGYATLCMTTVKETEDV